MKLHRRLWTLIVILLAWAAPCALAAPATQPAPQTLRLTLLHVNDVHGQLEPRTVNGKSVGGYARLLTAVEAAKKASTADKVFLIHAGDEFSRGDDLTTSTHGAANVAIMNRIGFDLWVPGNGEFYDGIVNLTQRIGEAHARTLGANLSLRDDEKMPLTPYVIERVGDLRIAFVGLCFIHKEHPSCWVTKMDDPIETARKLVPEIRKEADLVIAITHIGFDQDQKLAAGVAGIDLIVGAHSHTVLATGRRVKNPAGQNVLICQAGEHLNFMGKVDLTLAREQDTWRIKESFATLVPLDEKVKLDPAITALIARLSAEAATRPATVPATQPAEASGGR